MSDLQNTDSRFSDMEIRLSHQEKTIAELSDVISAQLKKIDALERQMRRLSEEMQAMDGAEAHPQQKPPHY
jgi:SlyX protein